MALDLWGERIPQPRRKRNVISHPTPAPLLITGTNNDCEILGHTLSVWDLAGCTICLDCNVKIFCPGCTPKHPTDEHAVSVCCARHEETMVSA